MTIKNTAYKTMMAVGLVLAAYSCANRAQGPTGGPKDVTPPKVVRSLPGNGALNYNKKLIQIDFDEQVSIEKANENVIVSPPQMKPPEVKSFGKRVTMVFNQDLMDSTTYTINFGNGIVDLNEKNPLKNYIFSFATGNEIDTLKVSGTLLNAEDLNPVSGIIVGVYRESDKSAFFEKPFLRIGKTDENGHFSIENMKPGTYKVYALGDLNQDYFFQAGEGAAILDSLVHPTFRIEEMKDTVWQDSTTIDSVRTYMGTRFLPDDLVLRYFKENKKRQYLAKSERKEPFVVNLFFNTQTTELPKIKPLNFDWEGKYLLQKNSTMDSLTYWITDSLVWKTDTLEMAVTYLKSDSLMKLVPTTDTLNLYSRKPRVNPKARASKTTVPKAEPFKLSTNIAGTFEIYNPVVIHFETPVADMDLSKVQLSQRVDTVLKPLTYKWRQLDSTKMSYALEYKWVPETSYELEIDSAAFSSIYKKTNNKYTSEFKIRSLDEYSSVKLYLTEFNPQAIFQVLDTKDAVVASAKANIKGTGIKYLKPGDYYVRMFVDENNNGKWDTGDLSAARQPEQVYYYPKKLTLMANWEFEETWDYKQIPLLQQKPAELKKDAGKKRGTE